MRLPIALAALTAAVLTAGAASAQDPATDGEYRAALTKMLTETTQGVCPADVMADSLLEACEGQVAQMAPALQSLGGIVSMNFIGAEGEGADKIERYEITYDAGPTLTWFIGSRGADGRFSSAGTGR
ncbi:MAG: hypothetical protein KJ676_04275 [Alphaproteobacteria bacterium]|nr:hypothetical protein [Alphaproteobacteria bacterium]MBU1526900.1 hypothetical protein [Alphaproteobacteria bacterium]MBU2116947.1 hypothetical protein [Alphaproteobacteria bacterium]MBU2351818.1 hypothetical protein [Alphaproteobacteria bacterium]MBU2383772.1 hypothetical protein [Alphaproteobacteria bacterium]